MPIIEKQSLQPLMPWFLAAQLNDTAAIQQWLQQSSFDIETRDGDGYTALMIAAIHGALDVARLLIESKANLEATCKDECTPLIVAAAHGQSQMMLLLLQHGANPLATDAHEWSALHWIANEDQWLLLRELRQQHAVYFKPLVHCKRWNGVAPLHMAESATMVKKLIQLGGVVDDADIDGDTPLMEAVFQGKLDVVQCLVRHGANILHVNHKGQTAVDRAENNIRLFLAEVLAPKSNKRDKKTSYAANVTAALAKREQALDEELIAFHASLRMDLLFFTLVAYYQTGLVPCIEPTQRQHGQGSKQTVACHSSLLPALSDRILQRTHGYDTRHGSVNVYRIGLFDGTYFENALNLTVELDKSVNYFDTYYIEGRSTTNAQLRQYALSVLSKVAKGEYDPVTGMNDFLNTMHRHLLSKQGEYFRKQELLTSPKKDRAKIFAAQYKGTFFNTCGVEAPDKIPPVMALREDYIHAQLPFSKENRIKLNAQPGLFSAQEKQRLYQEAFWQVKEDMDLPVQYQRR